MRLLLAVVTAACLIGGSALTAPTATAYAPPKVSQSCHRSAACRVAQLIKKAKACPPHHFCPSPIEVGKPRPRRP